MDLTFGERIMYRRKRLKLSQGELANLVGVSTSAISSYETERAKPTLEVFQRMVSVLGVSADWLLGETDELRVGD